MELPFDPSKVQYSRRYVRNSGRLKDGSPPTKRGPYWYACWMEQGRYRSFYLGREFPPSLRPYISDEAMAAEVEKRPDIPRDPHRRVSRKSFSYDSLRDSLDRGEQIVVDLSSIAVKCKAHCNKIGYNTYVLYRDPQ